MPDRTQGTLADLFTLTAAPPKLRRGSTRLLKGQANPAAGSNYAYKVSSDYWERILAVGFTLATSATAGYRSVSVAFVDADGNVFDANPGAGLVAASSTVTGYLDQQPQSPMPGGQSAYNYGTVTAPGTFTAFASITGLPAGMYTVEWQVGLAGTLTVGTDNDNVLITAGTPSIAQSINPALAGSWPQKPVAVYLNGSTGLIMETIRAGTAGSIYSGTLIATPTSPSFLLGQVPDLILKSGWQVQINVAGIAAGDQLSGITVLAERYPSNWADGDLAAEEERDIREFYRWAREQREGM